MKSSNVTTCLASLVLVYAACNSPAIAKGEVACDMLRSGLLVDVFGDEASAASYEPGSEFIPHSLCAATWNKPDHEALAAASSQYTTNKYMAIAMKKDFNEIEPPPANYTVSLTVIEQVFDSPEAAVASLESAVAQLTEGVTVTVKGQEHTSKVEFGDWLEGVGDKAIWATKLRELQVADAGRRFAVSVNGFVDAGQDYAKAVDLAGRIGEGG